MGILKYDEINFIKADELYSMLEFAFNELNIKKEEELNVIYEKELNDIQDIWANSDIDVPGSKLAIEKGTLLNSTKWFSDNKPESYIVYDFKKNISVDNAVAVSIRHIDNEYEEEVEGYIERCNIFMNLEIISKMHSSHDFKLLYNILISSKVPNISLNYSGNAISINSTEDISDDLINYFRYDVKDIIKEKYGVILSFIEQLATTGHVNTFSIKGHSVSIKESLDIKSDIDDILFYEFNDVKYLKIEKFRFTDDFIDIQFRNKLSDDEFEDYWEDDDYDSRYVNGLIDFKNVKEGILRLIDYLIMNDFEPYDYGGCGIFIHGPDFDPPRFIDYDEFEKLPDNSKISDVMVQFEKK